MVMMIVIVFTILNPLVIPFSMLYFSAAVGECPVCSLSTYTNSLFSYSQEPTDARVLEMVRPEGHRPLHPHPTLHPGWIYLRRG